MSRLAEKIVEQVRIGRGRSNILNTHFQRYLSQETNKKKREQMQTKYNKAKQERRNAKAKAKSKEAAYRRQQQLTEQRKLSSARIQRNTNYNSLSNENKLRQISQAYHGIVIVRPNGSTIIMNSIEPESNNLSSFKKYTNINKQAISKALKYIVELRSRYRRRENSGHQQAREKRTNLANKLKQKNSVVIPQNYKVKLYPRNVELERGVIKPSFLPNMTAEPLGNITLRVFQ